MFEKNKKWLCSYNKDSWSFVNGKQVQLNINKTPEDWAEEAKEFTDRDFNIRWTESTVLWIFRNDGFVFCIKNLSKYKEYDEAFIQKKIDSQLKKYENSYYGEFTKKMQLLLKNSDLSELFIYPTTYGIGVFSYMNWRAHENAEQVAKMLKENKIPYENEWSDAKWVYRFKINKKDIE